MTAVQNAMHARLVGIAGITSLVGTFQSLPAIFTGANIPNPMVGTYVVIHDSLVNDPFDTKTSVGRVLETDIGTYADESGDVTEVQAIAELIRDAFHREPLTVVGFGTLIARARGPIQVPTEQQMYGRIVTVQLTLIKA